MENNLHLTLEGKNHPVEEPAFGSVKKVTALFNAALREIIASVDTNQLPAEALEPATQIFAILLKKEVSEIEEMKIGALEALAAIHQAAEICGLKLKDEQPKGEA